MPDIDIDFADRQKILDVIPHTKASISDSKGFKSHNTGIYFTLCPSIPGTNQSSIDYQVAEALGYFKLDILNVNVYNLIKSREQLLELSNKEPPWHRLSEQTFVDKLFHLNGHYEVINTLKPNSVEKLACCLAIIRPAKRNLLYKSWEEIFKTVWSKPEDGQYFFKKAHAISYAKVVMLHMNLLDSSE